MKKAEFPAIQTIDEFKFHYFNTLLPVVKSKDGLLYVCVESLCSVFNLNMERHVRQLSQHTILQTGLGLAPIADVEAQIVLRISFLASWLANLILDELPKVRDREELLLFQQEAAQLLEEAFYEGRLSRWPTLSDLMSQDTVAAAIYKEALTTLALAREHLIAEGAYLNS